MAKKKAKKGGKKKKKKKASGKKKSSKKKASRRVAGKKKKAAKKKSKKKKKAASKPAGPKASTAMTAPASNAVRRCDSRRENRAESGGRMAVSDRIPAVTGNRSGMRRGAQALRRPLKLSGPSVPAGSTGRRGLVRETFLQAEDVDPPRPSRPAADFPCRNKGFAAHKSFASEDGGCI